MARPSSQRVLVASEIKQPERGSSQSPLVILRLRMNSVVPSPLKDFTDWCGSISTGAS